MTDLLELLNKIDEQQIAINQMREEVCHALSNRERRQYRLDRDGVRGLVREGIEKAGSGRRLAEAIHTSDQTISMILTGKRKGYALKPVLEAYLRPEIAPDGVRA
jgi:hypothetical protein